MNRETLCHVLEALRWIGVVAGFQLAYLAGHTPGERLHILTPWVVISVAGLTAVESLFLGRAAARISGYAPSAYQRQSGMNNLALALTALPVWLLGWGARAEAALLTVLLLFLSLSACNHLASAWRDRNRSLRNWLRPVLTAVLVAFTLPVLVGALRSAG